MFNALRADFIAYSLELIFNTIIYRYIEIKNHYKIQVYILEWLPISREIILPTNRYSILNSQSVGFTLRSPYLTKVASIFCSATIKLICYELIRKPLGNSTHYLKEKPDK